MSNEEHKISHVSEWLSVFQIIGGICVACALFYLNSTYVKQDDFIPVAREIKVQAEQVSYVNAEVKNISRRLSKIVDDDGNPVNTDKMVEIQRDITKILVKLENLGDKINNLEKKK